MSDEKLNEQTSQVEGESALNDLLYALNEICRLADHQIPHYGYGDCEAACMMADYLQNIWMIANRKLNELERV